MKKPLLLAPLVITAVVGIGAFATTVFTSAATTTQTGAWNLDENPIGPNSFVADVLGINHGKTPSDWSGSAVAPLASEGTGAFYFPGWTQLVGGKVDDTASSFTIPHNSVFNPDQKDFSVSLWVNALNPAELVSSGVMKSSDSLNIVQKGLAGGTRQQWKVSVSAVGKFHCTFRGKNASGGTVNFSAVSNKYAFGVTRQVICSLSGSTITLAVITNGVIDTYTASGPVGGVANTSDVTVGKKPGDTNAGDTFAGTIDNLQISKGL